MYLIVYELIDNEGIRILSQDIDCEPGDWVAAVMEQNPHISITVIFFLPLT